MEEGAGFVEANGFRVGKKIEGHFGGDAAIEECVFCGPRVVHSAVVDFLGAGIGIEEHGRDVIGLARVGESKKWARAGNHTMALVLAVRGMADFFGEGVVGVLESAHDWCLDTDVQRLQAVEVTRGIEQAIDGFEDRKSTRLNSSHSQISY